MAVPDGIGNVKKSEVGVEGPVTHEWMNEGTTKDIG